LLVVDFVTAPGHRSGALDSAPTALSRRSFQWATATPLERPIRRKRMTRLCLWLCALMAAAGSLAGCHYSEEAKWRSCCLMGIGIDGKSNTAYASAIVSLLSRQGFEPTGELMRPMDDRYLGTGIGPATKQSIATSMNRFLAAHPGERPSDYF